jgi:hypothetical protein
LDPLWEARFPVTVHIPCREVADPLAAFLVEPQPTAKTIEIKIKMRFILLSLTSDDN